MQSENSDSARRKVDATHNIFCSITYGKKMLLLFCQVYNILNHPSAKFSLQNYTHLEIGSIEISRA